jgi:hypothetical protein
MYPEPAAKDPKEDRLVLALIALGVMYFVIRLCIG